MLYSCAPLYTPNAPLVFNHQEQGDNGVTLRVGGFSSSLQGGYAVTDKLNLGGTISYHKSGESAAGNTTYESTEAGEVNLVAGYYNMITSKNLIELNAGFGPFLLTKPDGYSNYFKGYVQPSFTFIRQPKNRSYFTLLTRVTGTTFTEAVDNQLDTTRYVGYIEPALSYCFGKQFKFSSQLGLSLPLDVERRVRYSPFILNVGISYSFGKKEEVKTLPDPR